MNNLVKHSILILIASCFLSLETGAQINENIKEIVSIDFSEADRIISQKISQYGTTEVLVVLDIDNTILTSETDLGGDVWYAWQSGSLQLKPTQKQVVKCLFNDAIGLLYELGTMRLVDAAIPQFINSWQKSETTIFALTARDPRYRSATERELAKKGVSFAKTPLKPIGGEMPVYQYKVVKEMSYANGIMMVTGMNKGDMLNHILQKTARSFKAIIFIDDTEKNLTNVKNSFLSQKNVDLTLFRYEKVIQERMEANGGVILTQKQANKMDRDWKKLNSTFNRIFPGRTATDCVSPY
jgi:hypothetical protein